MTIQQTKGDVAEKIKVTQKDIEAYLREHPDFFETHMRLLADLKVPHATSGKAVSLIERQVDVLRKQNKKLQKQLDELIQIARDNDKLSKHIFRFTLDLISAHDLPEVLTTINENLRRDFNADAVAVFLTAEPLDDELLQHTAFSADMAVLIQLFGKGVNESKPICGRPREEQKSFLFGELGEKIESAALVPLQANNQRFGLVAVGSFDKQRFHAAMGTLFLTQMGRVVGAVVNRFLKSY